MIGLISLIGVFLVFFLKPLHGLILYYGLMIWYPVSIRIELAGCEFSVGRIIALALLVKLFMNQSVISRFRIQNADKFVFLTFLGQIISGVFTSDLGTLLINRFGSFLDSIFLYFVFRLLVQDKKDLIQTLRMFVILAAPLGLVAIFESITSYNLLAFGRDVGAMQPRWGLDRANAAFGHPIYFGVFMAIMLGFSVALWRIDSTYLLKTASACIGIGVFASLSSGAWLGAVCMISIVCLYRFRNLWKVVVGSLVVMAIFVEIFSNRHFYQVIDRIAMNPRTAWYRNRLIEVALWEGGMSGKWLLGYGFGVDPMWCTRIDGREHTDMVNHYLLILSSYGLVGVLPFLGSVFCCVKAVYKNLFQVGRELSWMLWALGATLLGLLLSIFSVSLFGQAFTFMYIFFGVCVSCDLYLKDGSPAEPGKGRKGPARPGMRNRMFPKPGVQGADSSGNILHT